jgi:hypothetical protein
MSLLLLLLCSLVWQVGAMLLLALVHKTPFVDAMIPDVAVR